MNKITLLIFVNIFISICSANSISNDPSLVPIIRSTGEVGERYRILGDFNMDGIKDMALSHDVTMFGNAGGFFEIFIRNKKGRYNKYGSIFLHTKAISFERVSQRKVRLWVYNRGGGSSGQLGYYVIDFNKLSGFNGIEIFPGDAGTKIGNLLYNAVFENSDIPFLVQKSYTINGSVKWKKF